MFIPSLLVFLGLIWTSQGLDNGVGLTPPMGWLSWLRYGCTTDCDKYPDECISENLIQKTANVMVDEGYLEAGYQYVVIDDCWPEMSRGSDGRLVADKSRFPNGILGLSRYVLVALSFFATGSYQKLVGGTYGTLMSQQSVSRTIRDVTAALNHPIVQSKWIKFPQTRQERNAIKRRFFEKFHIPSVIGCIDGTHVAIIRPVENEERFFNRKHFHSRNVLIVHDKGLKFGIYEDYGNFTCQHYPGVLGHEATDAATFLDWEVDYVKLDGCYGDVSSFDTGYPMFGKLLNETGRPMVYSCSWPAYQNNPNYSVIAKACNIWRNYGDIENNWESVVNIMNWFGDKQDQFAHLAGPGNFNDPDMLVIGNSGLTIDQARVQMAVWSVLAAPLIISADVALIKREFKEILQNKDVIAVDQDPLGKQGLRVFIGADNDVIWHREISDGARALAFVNVQDSAVEKTYTHEQMKLPSQDYVVQDLFKEDEERTLGGGEDLKVKINPTGVKFYKFVPKKEPASENEIK